MTATPLQGVSAYGGGGVVLTVQQHELNEPSCGRSGDGAVMEVHVLGDGCGVVVLVQQVVVVVVGGTHRLLGQ